MWKGSGYFKASKDLIYHQISTYNGSSGSPIIKRRNGEPYVVGIHIGGDIKLNINFGIRLTKKIKK